MKYVYLISFLIFKIYSCVWQNPLLCNMWSKRIFKKGRKTERNDDKDNYKEMTRVRKIIQY